MTRITAPIMGIALAIGVGSAALAAPTVIPPFTPGSPGTTTLSLSATMSPIEAIFLFSDAADRSILRFGGSPLFINNGAGASTPGTITTFTVPGTPTPIVFTLENTSSGQTYATNALDSDGNGHAISITGTTDLAEIESALGLASGAISGQAGVAAAWASFVSAASGPITIIAWEDLELDDPRSNREVDWDYNDLIFAFAGVLTTVPEPGSLAVLGAGLIGLGFAVRRRRS